MKTYFTSDLHFGHKNILKYDNRRFQTVEEMDVTIIENWNRKVTEKDTVYVLGDLSWYGTEKTIELYKQLNGKKILIMGNHDKKITNSIKSLFQYTTNYAELNVDSRKVVLCHYPIHMYNYQYRNGIMLYGHVHNSKDEVVSREFVKICNERGIPCEMYNVGTMLWNYEPVTLKEIISHDYSKDSLFGDDKHDDKR